MCWVDIENLSGSVVISPFVVSSGDTAQFLGGCGAAFPKAVWLWLMFILVTAPVRWLLALIYSCLSLCSVDVWAASFVLAQP